jgi:hypothetical protein
LWKSRSWSELFEKDLKVVFVEKSVWVWDELAGFQPGKDKKDRFFRENLFCGTVFLW